MAYNNPNDNPWEDQPGQQPNHQAQQSHQNPYQPYSDQSHSGGAAANPYSPPSQLYGGSTQQNAVYSDTNSSPWNTEPGHAPPAPHLSDQSHNPYNQQTQQNQYQHQQQQQQQPFSSNADRLGGGGGGFAQDEVPPNLPPRRTATDLALPTGQDRSHQIEVMQSYEAAGRKDEDDSNVEILQREFPKIDGSLIAAIYGDSKSLSATREMLQALE